LNPQPSIGDLERYYPDHYDPFSIGDPAELPVLQRFSLNYGLRKRCRLVTQHKSRGSLLEIGCAQGLFLDAMSRTGHWHVQGVEVNADAVSYARERLGLAVFHGPVEDAGFADGAFDAAVMWDVLEHVQRPRETLLEIRRVLKRDGVIVIRVPVLDSWDHKWFGRYWAGWDAPRHLTTFSRRTLGLLLENTGFRVEEMICRSGSYPAFVLSVRFWASEQLADGSARRLRNILEGLPLRLATAPFFYLIDRLGLSTVVTVVAQPDRGANAPAVTKVSRP
jgi:SAM-dependent methyltransferase